MLYYRQTVFSHKTIIELYTTLVGYPLAPRGGCCLQAYWGLKVDQPHISFARTVP